MNQRPFLESWYSFALTLALLYKVRSPVVFSHGF
jgi:hypothetical protein